MFRSTLLLILLFARLICFSQVEIKDLTSAFEKSKNFDSLFHEFYRENPAYDWPNFAKQSEEFTQSDSSQFYFLLSISTLLEKKNPQVGFSILDDCEKLGWEAENPVWIAQSYGAMSYILNYSANYSRSVELLSKALGLIDKEKDIAEYAGLMGDLARTYSDMEDYESAMKYFRKSNELFEQLGDEENLIINNFNIASAYMDLEINDSAIMIFEQIIQDAPEIYPLAEAYAYGNIGQVLVNKGLFKEAIQSQQKGLRIEQKLGDELAMMDSHAVLASAYAELQNADSSSYHFEKATLLALKHGISHKLMNIYSAQMEAFAALNDYKEAYNMSEKFRLLSDSLRSLEVRKTQLELKEKYETEEKEINNQQLAAEVNRQNQLIIVAAVLLIVAFVVTWYIFYINRKVRKQSKALKEATESKDRFFSNITHEFRTPLTLILFQLEKASASSDVSSEKMNQLIKSNHRHASQLLKLVNQLLELNKLESGHMVIKNTIGDFQDFIDQFLIRFKQAAENKNIPLKIVNKDVSGFYSFDRPKWERILSNLLGNALKFTEKGSIHVEFWQTDTGIGMNVSDTGVGIPKESLTHVFDRFYQADDSNSRAYEGTGIGLALVKELIDLMNGSIEVQSDSSGTTFFIEIPMKKMQKSEVEDSLAQTIFAEELVIDESKALILIVEDNYELRSLLREQLQEKWNVLEASNGEKGWEIIQKELPDVVLSDVMMPGMNGHELCSKTKNDPRTMHISFLMLTAKASQEAVVSGLEKGADDYITKPFHPHELELRIYNILQQQERLRQHLIQELMPRKVEDVKSAVPHIEDVFLKNMYAYVDKNLNDATLTADRLADEMAISKSTLNRKLRALLDITSVDFIRDIRLTRSVEFIKAGRSISETAYSVGFESPSYFTKIFKAKYHQTPSEFAEKLTN